MGMATLNMCSFPTVPKKDIAKANQVAASLFFEAVFGSSNAVKGLNFLIALSAFGNLLAVLLGSSRLVRECGRWVSPLLPQTTVMANVL
jgi:hypothetical protein